MTNGMSSISVPNVAPVALPAFRGLCIYSTATAIYPVRASLYLTCVVSSKSCTKGAHRAQIGGGEHESVLARS